MIRTAVSADAPDIAALWNVMIRDTLSTFTTIEKSGDEIAQRITQGDIILVAEENQRFAGFIALGPFRAGPGYNATVEHSIMVVDDVQGRAVAHNLLTAGEAAARAAGHHVMVAGISETNVRAVRFHAKHGYYQTGHMPEVGQKAGQWLGLILMQKIL